MAFILTGFLKTHLYGADGARIPVALDNENGILDNISARLPHTDRLVVVANNAYDHANNDEKRDVVAESFSMTGINFATAVALDARNGDRAREIVSGASLVILSGGKCLCQFDFFKRIGLGGILRAYRGLTVGISAGAMNLGKTVANFPEETADFDEPRLYGGLGLYDGIVIPHFDGERIEYQLGGEDFDVARDYILPMSAGHEFIGIPNGSYILVEDDGRTRFFGDIYKIADGAVARLNRRRTV